MSDELLHARIEAEVGLKRAAEARAEALERANYFNKVSAAAAYEKMAALTRENERLKAIMDKCDMCGTQMDALREGEGKKGA